MLSRLRKRALLLAGLLTCAWLMTGCSIKGRTDFSMSVLAPLNRECSAKDQQAQAAAEAAQLLADRGLLTVLGHDPAKAEAQLIYLGIRPEEARRRILAARVAIETGGTR